MPQQCFKPFRAQSIRVTELDDCCIPPPPADASPGDDDSPGMPCSIAGTNSFITVTAEAQVDEGEDILERKANGDICISEQDPSVLRGFNVSIELCQVVPWFINKLTGWPIVMDADCNAIGFDIMDGVNTTQSAVEMWTGVSGIDCGEGARYGYLLFPCVENWQVDGEIEFGGSDTLTSITLTGFAKGAHAWGRGPYTDVQGSFDGRLVDPMQQGSILRLMATDVAPPAYIGDCTECLPPTAEYGYGGLSLESPADPCLVPA